jgi:hypothetical protein
VTDRGVEPAGFGGDVLVPFVEGGGLVVLQGGDVALPAGPLPRARLGVLVPAALEVGVEVVELAGDASDRPVLVGTGPSCEVFPPDVEGVELDEAAARAWWSPALSRRRWRWGRV